MVILVGGLAFWISFIIFNNLAGYLRPEYQTVDRVNFHLSIERLIVVFRVLLPVVLVLLLHESIHFILLWMYTKECPKFIVTSEGIGSIAVRMPSWYFSRNAFLIANLAPVCLLTLGFPFLVLVVPQEVINTLVFCAAINLAGSLPDIASSVYILFHPADTYVNTNGSIFHNQELSSVPRWKLRFRTYIERILEKFE